MQRRGREGEPFSVKFCELGKWVIGEVTWPPPPSPFPLHSISGSATGGMFIMCQQVTGSQWWVRYVATS